MRSGLILLGVLVFIAALVARLPLSLVTANAPMPLTYESVSGTLWKGRMTGIEVDGEKVGDAAVSVKLLPLLAGKATARLELAGRGITGQGAVTLTTGQVTVERANAVLDLARFGLVDVFGQTLRGHLDAEIRKVTYSRAGCEEADLSVSTDALSRSLAAYGLEGFPLAGEGRCEGSDLVIPLAGENPDARVAAELRLEPTGRYRSSLRITPSAPQLGFVLESAGFRREGDAFLAERSGMLEAAL